MQTNAPGWLVGWHSVNIYTIGTKCRKDKEGYGVIIAGREGRETGAMKKEKKRMKEKIRTRDVDQSQMSRNLPRL